MRFQVFLFFLLVCVFISLYKIIYYASVNQGIPNFLSNGKLHFEGVHRHVCWLKIHTMGKEDDGRSFPLAMWSDLYNRSRVKRKFRVDLLFICPGKFENVFVNRSGASLRFDEIRFLHPSMNTLIYIILDLHLFFLIAVFAKVTLDAASPWCS